MVSGGKWHAGNEHALLDLRSDRPAVDGDGEARYWHDVDCNGGHSTSFKARKPRHRAVPAADDGRALMQHPDSAGAALR